MHSALEQGVHSGQTALTGGDEVLDDHYPLASAEHSLDLVAHAVVLGLGADINEGLAHHLSDYGTVGDGSGGYTGYHVHILECGVDHVYHGLADGPAEGRIGQGLAVVTVDG